MDILQKIKTASLNRPKLFALSGVYSFMFILIVFVIVYFMLEYTTSSKFLYLLLLSLSYIIWLSLFLFGFLFLPKTQTDFIAHATSSEHFLREFDFGKNRIRNNETSPEMETEEVLVHYNRGFRGFFITILISYFLSLAALIFLGATFSYTLVNTSDGWESGYKHIQGECIGEVDNTFEKDLKANNDIPESIKSYFFERFSYRFDPSAKMYAQNGSWLIKDKRDKFIMIKNGEKLEFYNNDCTFLNHFYLSTMTIFTVGYGDIYPSSKLSRITAIIECFSVFIVLIFGLSYIISFESSRISNVKNAIIVELKQAQ